MAATVKDDASARKKFIPPVTVPTWGRATAFWMETTVIGNVVPRPSENTDSRNPMKKNGAYNRIDRMPALRQAVISPRCWSAPSENKTANIVAIERTDGARNELIEPQALQR